MPLLSFLLRLLLVAAGLVFAASIVVVFVLLLAVWSIGALWARLAGRPASPFVMRMGPRRAFEEVVRRAPAASRTPRADAAAGPGAVPPTVTDVEARELRS